MRGPILDRYEIIGELGQGGMSVVYRARDKQLSREVAVKVLHDFLARQPDARKRLHREAVAVAKLHHPGILEIFDYSGPDAEQSFIVTELIDGVTLRDFVDARGHPRFPELAMLVVSELVRALRHAHEQSVIHRDLKPENVMITHDGVLKLMDFGLAQLVDGGTRLTATGTLLGSPAHMAPEVIDGKASDARADIFSMGTILYWLSTGRLPFEAPNPSALFKRILDGAYEDPQIAQPKIGNGLARIIARALAPRVEARYQDITELYADLIRELDEVAIGPVEPAAKAYLADPDGFSRELEPKLIEALLKSGREAIEAGNVARAMDSLNRVLAIDPEHEEVRHLVARIGRKRRLRRFAKQAVVATVLAAGLGAVAWAASTVERAREPSERVEEAPAVAAVTAVIATPEVSEPKDAEAKAPAPEPARRRGRGSGQRQGQGQRQGVEPGPGPGPGPDAHGTTETGAAQAPAKPQLKLRVVIGHGIAKRLLIDGQAHEFSGYDGTFEVGPGRHRVVVVNDLGRLEPVTIEVRPDGAIFKNGFGKPLDARGLEIRVPASQDEAKTFPGWTPS